MLVFSGALHAGDHAGFKEQRHAEDSRLQPRACGETAEAAEESGGCFLPQNNQLGKLNLKDDLNV